MRNTFGAFTETLTNSVIRGQVLNKLRVGVAGLVLACVGSADGQVQPRVVWAYTNASLSVSPQAMALDVSGNVIVAGYDTGDYWTAKFGPTGNLLWSARQKGRVGDLVVAPGVTSLAVDAAGNVYVTGGLGGQRSYTTTFCFITCTTFHIYAADQVTIKYNSQGQRQWVASYSEQGDQSFVGSGIVVDGAGNVYVAGTGTVKYDANGNQLWLATNLSTLSVVLDSATNVYLGTSSAVRKLNRDGAQLWSVAGNGSVLRLDGAGNLLASGTGYPGPTTKLNANGRVLWTAPFGGQLALGASGSIYLASTISLTYPHYATVKLDSQGGLVWQAINDHGSYNSTSVSGMGIDSSENVYVSGADNSISTTVKYGVDGLRVWESTIPSGSFPTLAVDGAGNIYLAGNSSGFQLIKYAQVSAPGAPVIAPPPQHPLIRLGDDVTLSVNANGTGPLSYQWRNVSGNYSRIIPDATNATLSILGVQAAQAGMYSVEITNALGSTASPEVYLSVLSPLLSQTVVLGATAVFRAPLSGGGPAGFQWRFNGVNLPGETRSMLAVTNVGPSQVGDYVVVVSNYYGNVLTSTVAQLSLDSHVVQAWAATVPGGNVGDTAQAVGIDASSNVFVVGYSACGYKLVKYDSVGVEQWETCVPGSGTLAGLAVDPTSAVGVAGGFSVSKYSGSGTLLWNSPFGGAGSSNNVASAITVDSAGNFYVTGTTAATNGYGIVTVKYSPAGQQLWATLYAGTSDDFASQIIVDQVGNVYVSGAVLGASYDFVVLKYSARGNIVWSNTYDGPVGGSDVGAHLAVDAAGFVYVTGWSPGTNGVTDFATVKYDPTGGRLWVARYEGPGSGEDNPHGIGIDASGNVYVTGSSVGADNLYHIATVKYGPDGSELWVRRYTGPANGNDYSRALALDPAGNVYVEGHSESGPGPTPPTEVVTLSYDNAGNLRWAARCDTGFESGPYYRNGSIAVDTNATVYVADTTFTSGTPAFLTLKYVQRTPFPARLALPLVSSSGQLRCGLTGEPGARYTIQVSADLINWGSVTTVVTTTTGEAEFSDTAPTGATQRFYRAAQQ